MLDDDAALSKGGARHSSSDHILFALCLCPVAHSAPSFTTSSPKGIPGLGMHSNQAGWGPRHQGLHKTGKPRAMPPGPGPEQLCLALETRDPPALLTTAHSTVSTAGDSRMGSSGELGAGRSGTRSHTRGRVDPQFHLCKKSHQFWPALAASQRASVSSDKELSVGKRE